MEWKCDECLSRNRRRILSLWLPRLSTDRISASLARDNASPAEPNAGDDPCIVVVRQTMRCRFPRWMMPRRISVLKSACRWPMPAPSVAIKGVRCR